MKSDPSPGHSSSLLMSHSPFRLIHFFHQPWWHIDRWHGADTQSTTEHHSTAQMMVQAEQWSTVHFTALWVMGAPVPHSYGPVQPKPRKSQVNYMVKWINDKNFSRGEATLQHTGCIVIDIIHTPAPESLTNKNIKYRHDLLLAIMTHEMVSSSIKTSQSSILFFNLEKDI